MRVVFVTQSRYETNPGGLYDVSEAVEEEELHLNTLSFPEMLPVHMLSTLH